MDVPGFQSRSRRRSLNLARAGADSASQVNGTCGRQDWININNATGLYDTAFAEITTGGLPVQRCGELRLAYADWPVDDRFRITAVSSRWHLNVTNTNRIVTNTDVSLRATVNGSTETLLDLSDQSPGLRADTNPYVLTVTEPVGGWTWALVNTVRLDLAVDIGIVADALRYVRCYAAELDVTTVARNRDL